MLFFLQDTHRTNSTFILFTSPVLLSSALLHQPLFRHQSYPAPFYISSPLLHLLPLLLYLRQQCQSSAYSRWCFSLDSVAASAIFIDISFPRFFLKKFSGTSSFCVHSVSVLLLPSSSSRGWGDRRKRSMTSTMITIHSQLCCFVCL